MQETCLITICSPLSYLLSRSFINLSTLFVGSINIFVNIVLVHMSLIYLTLPVWFHYILTIQPGIIPAK